VGCAAAGFPAAGRVTLQLPPSAAVCPDIFHTNFRATVTEAKERAAVRGFQGFLHRAALPSGVELKPFSFVPRFAAR
jgi:hypothetical protein